MVAESAAGDPPHAESSSAAARMIRARTTLPPFSPQEAERQAEFTAAVIVVGESRAEVGHPPVTGVDTDHERPPDVKVDAAAEDAPYRGFSVYTAANRASVGNRCPRRIGDVGSDEDADVGLDRRRGRMRLERIPANAHLHAEHVRGASERAVGRRDLAGDTGDICDLEGNCEVLADVMDVLEAPEGADVGYA